MKRLLIICLLFINSYSTAQIIVDNVDVNAQPIKYLEILGVQKFMSFKVTVSVDYGQSIKWGAIQAIKGPDGKNMEFNGMVEALNFFDKNGWEYVNNFAVSEGQQSVYHYLLRRKNNQDL